MNYITTKETAVLWNLSSRRITVLASEGRIPGAKLMGKTWLIPENAVKPVDARVKKHIKIEEEYFFPLPIFVYDSYETAKKNLSEFQLELFNAQRLCVSGNFEQADVLLTRILNSTDNLCMTLGALYFKVFTDIYLNNKESLFNTYTKVYQINLSHIEKKEELSLILLDLKGILTSNKEYIENFRINRDYNYSSEYLPYIILIETYTSFITAFTSGKKSNPEFMESACIFMKQNKYSYSEIFIHLYLALMYKMNEDFDNYFFHIQKSLQLAEEKEIVLPFMLSFTIIKNEIMNYKPADTNSVIKKLPMLSKTFQENADKFLQSKNVAKIYYNLNSDEMDLIENARLGYTNKEVAKLKNISESYVNKKYFQLLKKTGTSSKMELVEMFINDIKS